MMNQIKKTAFFLLLLLPFLVRCLPVHAQQYVLSYTAEAGYYRYWQDQVWDEEEQIWRQVTETYWYPITDFKVWGYTFQVEYTNGALQNITLTPYTTAYASNTQLTFAGVVMLSGVPKKIHFKWAIGQTNGSYIINPTYDNVYNYPSNGCSMYPINAGDGYFHDPNQDYHGGVILSPQIYILSSNKPSNLSGVNTLCGGQTATLQAPCMFTDNSYAFPKPAGAVDYNDNFTWEVSEDPNFSSWKTLTKYKGQIAIGENDYNTVKYNTPHYYRVRTGPMTSEVSDAITFKNPPPSPNVRDAQSPLCYGAKGKAVLSGFSYPDGSAYTGQETLNFSIKPAGGFPGPNIPSTSGSITFDNLDPGDYEVAITTAGGCSQIIPLKINPPPAAIQVSATPACSGGAPALNMGASGGAGGYQYSIDNGNTFSTNTLFTNLLPGTTYQLAVKDANGCTMPSSIPLPAAVTVQATPQDPSAPGAADGSITLTPGGGAGAPYTYSLDNVSWQSSNVFSGLAQGSYSCQAKDVNGCISAVLSVPLQDPLPVSVLTAVTQISCYGRSDGRVEVSASGGKPPFTYSSDGVTFLPINTFSSLADGSYTVWAKDSKGTTGSAGFTISMPQALSVNVSSRKDAVCKDVANGQITVSATGGTGVLQYALNTGAYQAQPTFNVGAGQYTVTVMDANSCSAATPQVSIAEPAQAVSITATPAAANCNGEASGSITIGVSNGTAPFRYQVSGGAWQTDQELRGLTAGAYTVNVEDNNGCPASKSNITINEPPLLTIARDAQTDATCFNATDGSITVSSAGGSGTVLYYINTAPTVPNSTGIFKGLAAGSYTITAKDDHNCTAVAGGNIAQPTLLQATANVTPVTCYGNANGQFTLQPAGGTPAYVYSADGITYNSNATFKNLPAGTYTYYIKDSHNCTASTPVDIKQPPVLSFTTAVSNALCQGGATGTITVTAAGGTGPYQYSVNGNPFQSGNVLNNVSAGTPLVSVMDANSCVKSNNVPVGEPAVLTLQVTNKQPAKCFGGNDAAITVQAGGGKGPYQYAINSGAYQASPVFNTLTAGTYTITVQDANACTFSIPATASEPEELSLRMGSKANILCAGASTGSMQLQATGGVGGYLYSLDGVAFQTNATYSQLPAGNYTITIKDNNQCTAAFPVQLVDLYAPLSASLNAAAPATCADKGSITVTNVQGGLAPYSYSLDNAGYTTDPLFSNLYNGDYTVYIKDVNGCTITRSISPYGPVSMRGTLQLQPATCNAQSNGSIKVTNVTGGNNVYEYSLDGTTYQPSNEFLNLRAGVYQVHVRDIPYTCQVVLTGEVKEPALLGLQVTSNIPVGCFNGSNGALTVQGTGGTSGYTFSLNGSAFNAAASFTGLSAGNYTIQVKDANSCISQLPATVAQPTVLTAAITSSRNISCSGNGDGQITIKASGGTTPYRYSLDGVNYQNNPVFANLQKGSYTIEVKDNNGCTQQVTGTITEPAALQMQVQQTTDIACFGTATGQITIAASGGAGAYIFALNNLPAQGSGVFTNLTAGSYLLSVSDSNACTSRQTITLQQPALLQLSKQVQQPTCNYGTDGSIAVTVSGGQTPYTYSWNNSSNTSNTLPDLGGGMYKVTVTDANGCQLQDSALLVQPTAMELNVGFEDTVLCVGQTITVDAGNPGASYSWISDAGFSDNRQAVQLNKDGHYTVTVTTPSGCVAKDSFNITTSTSALQADFLLSSYGTVGDTVMIVDVSKPKPASHEWTLPLGAVDAGSAAEGTIRQLVFNNTGVYTIQMRVGLGECTDLISKNITILAKGQQGQVDSLLGYRERLIKEITAYPNPSDGPFKVRVTLSKAADIQLKLISFNNGDVITVKTAAGLDNYEIPFDASQLPQGIYLIAVQVEKEYQVIRVLKL